MKAVVFHAVRDIRLDDAPEPKIRDANDAIVRLTASAVCGTDLHMVRGTVPGMKPGTILGHEGVGVVEEAGRSLWLLWCRAGGNPFRRYRRRLRLLGSVIKAYKAFDLRQPGWIKVELEPALAT